jgi:hypothetical protein
MMPFAILDCSSEVKQEFYPEAIRIFSLEPPIKPLNLGFAELQYELAP